MLTDFLFTDLTTPNARPFTGFASGAFADMLGRKVEFKDAERDEYLRNTADAIAQMQAKGMPGLPIDSRDHGGDAAGWIVAAEPAEITDTAGLVRKAISFVAEWTELGIELINKRLQANFSPTVDIRRKTIRGGSLTNWPASKDDNGFPLFDAVLLSEGVHAHAPADTGNAYELFGRLNAIASEFRAALSSWREKSGDGTAALSEIETGVNMEIKLEDLTEEQRAALLEEARAELAAEQAKPAEPELPELDLSDAPNGEAMLAKAREMLKAEYAKMQGDFEAKLSEAMAELKRDEEIAAFAEKVTSGAAGRALPVGRDEIVTFLADLPAAHREAAQSILLRTVEGGLTEFDEVGHGKRLRGLTQLDPQIGALLRTHVENGGEIGEFFEVSGLGDPAEYDLSEYAQKEQ